MQKDVKTSKPFKNEAFEQTLRSRFVEGRWVPGQRLPTRSELLAEFPMSLSTMQQALDRLASDGFIEARGNLGTFVSPHPPHLYRYALVFPSRLDGFQGWTDWWTTLEQAATTVVRAEPQKQIVPFYDVTGHADVEDYQRLLGDVRTRRLAGIILVTAPHLLRNTSLLDDCPVPRVYIGDASRQWKIPAVSPSLHGFIDRALEHAAGQSRRRPMFLSPDININAIWPAWSEACQRHGMELARERVLFLPILPPAPRHLTQILMQLPPEKRPDALVVADDHFVEEVTAGLLTSNLPESELPTVIAYANFPSPPRTHLPVTFLGYDSAQIIRTCIDVLDMQRRGQTPPQTTLVPTVFASELAPGELSETRATSGGAMFWRTSQHSSYFGAESP